MGAACTGAAATGVGSSVSLNGLIIAGIFINLTSPEKVVIDKKAPSGDKRASEGSSK